jgi:5-methylcytosine-specific restriction endonuclease McrA
VARTMRKKASRLRKYHAQVCVMCGATDNLSVDHIIPLSHGGADELANTQILCIPCHRIKDGIKSRSTKLVRSRTRAERKYDFYFPNVRGQSG